MTGRLFKALEYAKSVIEVPGRKTSNNAPVSDIRGVFGVLQALLEIATIFGEGNPAIVG